MRAARKLFEQHGMEDCTIRDIARKAGVSPASVVVHFKSKTALLEDAVNSDIKKVLTELMASIPEDLGLLDRIMHFSRGFLTLYDKNRDLYRALIRHTIFEPAKETPNITKQSEQYLRFLSLMVEEEKARGTIKPEVDSTVAVLGIASLYIGSIVLLLRTPEMTVEAVAHVLESMTGQYLNGIANKSA